MKRRLRLPSPAMLVALAALVTSAGGTVTAASLITSANIRDNTIRSVDIRDETIKSRDVDNGSLTGLDVKNGSMTGADVANNSLTGADVREPTLAKVPTAANSDRLGGYLANQLVRATTATSTSINDNFNSCPFTTVLSRTVTAPTKGILLVWASTVVQNDISGDPFTLFGSRVTVNGVPATLPSEVALDGSNVDFEDTVTITGAIPVNAGNSAVALQASECGAGLAWIAEKSITTLFVPFGNTGQQGTLMASDLAASANSGRTQQNDE